MKKVLGKLFVYFFLLFCSVLLFGADAFRSIEHIPSANGLSYLSFNLQKGYVDVLQPHIVDPWDVGRQTPNLVNYIDAQISIQGQQVRFSQIPIAHVGYVNGTGIIRVEYDLPRLKVVSYIWTPMTMEQKVAIMVIHLPADQYYSIQPSDVQFLLNAQSPNVLSIRTKDVHSKGIWVGQVVMDVSGLLQENVNSMQNELIKAKPNLLLEAEERSWMHWHGMVTIPENIYGTSYDLLKQSAAFIKMAQCREPGPSYGQIVNSLSPNYEKKTIVRDMSYAIVALARLGYVTECRDALLFLLNSESGRFESLRIDGIQYGMGRPYSLSLSHFDGMGHERAGFIGGYPVFHFDGQGLFLWAFFEHLKRTTDFEFAKKHWPQVKQTIVEPLIHSVDETGLVRPDGGWWEKPYPGEHFTFTSLTAYNGLNSASTVAHLLEFDAQSDRYIKTAADLRANILTKLTIGKSLMMARSLETTDFPFFLDATVVEAVNWRVVDPYWKTANSISQSLDAFFRIADSTRGFCLGYAEDKIQMPESPFVTLRAFKALNKLGEKQKANVVLNWIIEQALRNADMVPDYMDNDTAAYSGAYPMIGLGAAPLILAIMPD